MDWFRGIDAAVTICDNKGIIVYMNKKSEQVFKSDGGKDLLGKSMFACHPEPALAKLKDLLHSGRTNTYTIEKNGKKKLIHQTPWLVDNVAKGLVEFSIELPDEMNHFIRS